MKNSSLIVRILYVILGLAVSWAIVYYTDGTSRAYVYVFFFPMILSAYYWGKYGGLLTAVLAGMLAGPFMPLNVYPHISQTDSNWIVRLLFFVAFSVGTGYLFDRLKRQNNVLVEQKIELEQSHQQIERQAMDIEEQRQRIQEFGTEMIEVLSEAIEVRDSFTHGHCTRVARMAHKIALRMGLDDSELLHLYWSALIHDVGKIGIPEAILNKPGQLTDYEYDVVKQHPSLGGFILQRTTYAEHILAGVVHHHERLDGKGYPDGLRDKEIALQAKIIAVSDVWDALTTDRPYREAMTKDQALNIMRNGRGTQFDPAILDMFLELIEEESAVATG